MAGGVLRRVADRTAMASVPSNEIDVPQGYGASSWACTSASTSPRKCSGASWTRQPGVISVSSERGLDDTVQLRRARLAKPKPAASSRSHKRVVPAVLAEAEQDGGIGDPRAVVGDGDDERHLACRRRAVPSGLAGGVRKPKYARAWRRRGGCSAGSRRRCRRGLRNRCGSPASRRFRGCGRGSSGSWTDLHAIAEEETPRPAERVPGGAFWRGLRSPSGRGGGTRGCPSGPAAHHAR